MGPGLGHSKGVEFEKLVAEIFKRCGFKVIHNAKLKGKSGVEHQIDVYAEYRTPLLTFRIVVECKNWDRPINKDVIMKVANIVRDLGFDRGIVVSSSGATYDAIVTARSMNVDVWDGTKVKELVKSLGINVEIPELKAIEYVKPRYNVDEAINTAKSLYNRGIIRKSRLDHAKPVMYPLYLVEAEGCVYKVKGVLKKKSEPRLVRVTLIIDGIAASVIHYSRNKGLEHLVNIPPDLGHDECEAIRVLKLHSKLTAQQLASLIGTSEAKARRILQGLISRGLVESFKISRYEPIRYTLKPDFIDAIKRLTSEPIEVDTVKGEIPFDVVQPMITPLDVERIVLVLLDGKVVSSKLIYYPILVCKVIESDGSVTIRALDLVSLKELPELSAALTRLGVLK